MPYINLIEVHRISARREARGVRMGLIALGSVSAVAVLVYGTLFFQKEMRAGEARSLQANVDKLKPLEAEIAASQKEKGELEPRLKTLDDAQKLTGRWSRILTHLATNTPRAAWLTGIRCTADAEHPINVSLGGVGQAQADAAEFMMRCQNAKDLENVQLRFTQEKMMDAATAIEFEVGADIVDTAPPKVVKEGAAPEGAKS